MDTSALENQTTMLSRAHLAVVLNPTTSVFDWDRIGILERETALYRLIRQQLSGITLISFGDGRDLDYVPKLEGLEIIANTERLPAREFIKKLSGAEIWKHSPTNIIKSNQVLGADHALHLAQALGARFVARCGYLQSEFVKHTRNPLKRVIKNILTARVEKKIFSQADKCIVTTNTMKKIIEKKYNIPQNAISVVPNFVNDMFFSEFEKKHPDTGDILFVGRLEEQKNLHTLILAAAQVPGVRLTFAGEGNLAPVLRQLAAAHSVQLNLLGRVNNTDLPALMAAHTLFVLPSLYEGHPKSLLEAMAAGMPVIGTAVPGITDSIEHGITGLLCPPTPEGLQNAINQLLENKELRDNLGQTARRTAQDTLSLPTVASRELEALAAACTPNVTMADAHR